MRNNPYWRETHPKVVKFLQSHCAENDSEFVSCATFDVGARAKGEIWRVVHYTFKKDGKTESPMILERPLLKSLGISPNWHLQGEGR
jgi:hypothetical protein